MTLFEVRPSLGKGSTPAKSDKQDLSAYDLATTKSPPCFEWFASPQTLSLSINMNEAESACGELYQKVRLTWSAFRSIIGGEKDPLRPDSGLLKRLIGYCWPHK